MNYYNENDRGAADWLQSLINRCLIPPGHVDRRSITDVELSDLEGFTQCHFFAGIGGWSRALELANWAPDRPVWTGSCPCQPFSAAGDQRGFADERHLWPHFYRLIKECRPSIIFGEQVSGKPGYQWLDHVQDDMEACGYAFGAATSPACSVGAPHLRQRLYWGAVADAGSERRQQEPRGTSGDEVSNGRRQKADHFASGNGEGDPLADACGARLEKRIGNAGVSEKAHGEQAREELADDRHTTGFWAEADWLECSDGKARPVEPGTLPLAYGVSDRVAQLKGYGNAIVPPQAEVFIRSFIEAAQEVA